MNSVDMDQTVYRANIYLRERPTEENLICNIFIIFCPSRISMVITRTLIRSHRCRQAICVWWTAPFQDAPHKSGVCVDKLKADQITICFHFNLIKKGVGTGEIMIDFGNGFADKDLHGLTDWNWDGVLGGRRQRNGQRKRPENDWVSMLMYAGRYVGR